MELYDFISPPKEIMPGESVARHLFLKQQWQLREFPGDEPEEDVFRIVYKIERERLRFPGETLEQIFSRRNNIVYDRQLNILSDFDSRFEGGNLEKVRKLEDRRYVLLLQDDTNTTGYNLWFFFKCQGHKRHDNLHFDIVNMRKNYSLFRNGMRICAYSRKRYEKQGIGWHRAGDNIEYHPNEIVQSGRSLHTLHFQYRCLYSDDEVSYKKVYRQLYFSYSYPYGYTDVMKLVRSIDLRDTSKKKQQTLSTVGQTISGNDVPMISLGRKGKPLIVLMARAHPSETPSSFIMQGVIKMLLSDQPQAKFLLENCQVVLFPMLNPDGVIHGNSRTSYTGCDLNRRWMKPTPQLQPQIYLIKSAIRRALEDCPPLISIDLHSHSGKQNVFFYGCQGYAGLYEVRQFPMIMSKLKGYYSLKQSCYLVQQERLSTARVTLAKYFKGLSYTIQTSILGNSCDIKHYRRKDYLQMGKSLVKGLAIHRSFTVVIPINTLSQSIAPFLLAINRKSFAAELKQAAKLQEETESLDDSSDSAKSQSNLPENEVTNNIRRVLKRTDRLLTSRQSSLKSDRPTLKKLRNRNKTILASHRDDESKSANISFREEQEYYFNFKIRKMSKGRQH